VFAAALIYIKTIGQQGFYCPKTPSECPEMSSTMMLRGANFPGMAMHIAALKLSIEPAMKPGVTNKKRASAARA
jgi:hypothetical protein